MKNPFIIRKRTAIVEDRVISGCRSCRYRIRAHEKGVSTQNWCERNNYKVLGNINTIPDDCNYVVRKG